MGNVRNDVRYPLLRYFANIFEQGFVQIEGYFDVNFGNVETRFLPMENRVEYNATRRINTVQTISRSFHVQSAYISVFNRHTKHTHKPQSAVDRTLSRVFQIFTIMNNKKQ